ncbi:hypothetical protein HQN90_14180 [Paenibacillus alba]|nr:hypothetical protein [Paenibacillus alba]
MKKPSVYEANNPQMQAEPAKKAVSEGKKHRPGFETAKKAGSPREGGDIPANASRASRKGRLRREKASPLL